MKMMSVHILSLMTLMISKPQKHSLYACVVMSSFEYDLYATAITINIVLVFNHLLGELSALLMLLFQLALLFLGSSERSYHGSRNL
jgi:hypothetical protein